MSRKSLFAALNKANLNAEAGLSKVAVAADLAVLVHRAGLKRSDVAERLGWTRSRVSQVLSGEGNLTIETIHAVANAAGCAFDVVFRDKEAERAIQQWERPTQLELHVDGAIQFPRRSTARVSFDGVQAIVTNNLQSFEGTSGGTDEWPLAA